MVWGSDMSRMLLGTIAFGIIAFTGCGSDRQEKLLQEVTEQMAAARSLADGYDFDGARRTLKGLAESIESAANVSNHDRLIADVEDALSAIAEREHHYRAKLEQGWVVFDGRLVPSAERERVVQQRRQKAEEDAAQAEAERKKRPAIRVTASELFAEFRNDAGQAGEKYDRRKILVVGEVHDVVTDKGDDAVYLRLATGTAAFVRCEFAADHKAKLGALTKGTVVNVCGTCIGKTGLHVGLRRCSLLE